MTEVASLLRQISACTRAIQEARDVAIAEALQTAVCPRCGARVDTAAYQGFIEVGKVLVPGHGFNRERSQRAENGGQS